MKNAVLLFIMAMGIGTGWTASLHGQDAAGEGTAATPPATRPAVDVSNLFKQEGTDPTFKSIMDEKKIPVGKNSTDGITGSIIRVNHEILDKLPTAKNPIPQNIRIHTLGNSAIPRQDFAKWSRWYQEDGNTQIFRLFKDETNVRNQRPFSARVEAFGNLTWAKGEWHEWEGTYTIVKPHPFMIFQVKNNKNDWAVSIGMNGEGDIGLTNRRPKVSKNLAKNMTGKSFVLKIRDNGEDFEVYFNGEKVHEGKYLRPEGTTGFRWGMYRGEAKVTHDAMIFVTGATFK